MTPIIDNILSCITNMNISIPINIVTNGCSFIKFIIFFISLYLLYTECKKYEACLGLIPLLEANLIDPPKKIFRDKISFRF